MKSFNKRKNAVTTSGANIGLINSVNATCMKPEWEVLWHADIMELQR